MMVESHSVTFHLCWLVVFQIVLFVQDDIGPYLFPLFVSLTIEFVGIVDLLFKGITKLPIGQIVSKVKTTCGDTM